MKLSYLPIEDIQRVRNIKDAFTRAEIFADVARLNILYMIMKAGSGHIGTSFSAIDIMSLLWLKEMESPNDASAKTGDTYFSSKGHDAPAMYALLIGLEKLDFKLIHKLRRLGGLPGHPDVSTPHMTTNTGSLGMGVSKARGMAQARRLRSEKGRYYVLMGDGELQEGHLWESLGPTANGKFSEITVIVDHNKIQSDLLIKETSDLGDIEAKFRAFGWEVRRCDGHNLKEVSKILAEFKKIKDRPQVLIADTKKGKGVSFMERTASDGFYKYHSGAPSYDDYMQAKKEIGVRVNAKLKSLGEKELEFIEVDAPERVVPANPQKLVRAYGEELVRLADEHKDIIAMDADLVLDTGLIPFKNKFPKRYVEAGIAEQDMVSMAGGLALSGKLPIVHSFACFLSTRPNEQIYNNATELTKIIYTGSLAGLLPATPGHSHQSVRDISLFGSIPGFTLIEPSCEDEARLVLRWAVEENSESTYIRLVSIPVEISFSLSKNYKLKKGRGMKLEDGKGVAIVAYGPVMLKEACLAAELLSKKGKKVAVYNLPWLNFIDEKWVKTELGKYKNIISIDDHYLSFGQGGLLAEVIQRASMNNTTLTRLGVSEIPKCGAGDEVLAYHGLDASAIAKTILKL